MDVLICLDGGKDEFGFALGKASQTAKWNGALIFVYSDGNFLRMTDSYPHENLGIIVGKCYPGGRIVSNRTEKEIGT